MNNLLVPKVKELSRSLSIGTATYDVQFNPYSPRIRVTTTGDIAVCSDWLSRNNVANGNYFPLGVAFHSNVPNQLLTLSTRNECLVIQLKDLQRQPTQRDLLVFLRDDCTCFAYGLNSFTEDNYFIDTRGLRPSLIFGRLIDLRYMFPHQEDTSLGGFSNHVLGGRVEEPEVLSNTLKYPFLKKRQLLQTVSQAHISFLIGDSFYNGPRHFNHFPRVINSNYPLKVHVWNDEDNLGNRIVMAVNENQNYNVKVHYTSNLLVLRRWLDETEIEEEGRSKLLGLAVLPNDDFPTKPYVGVAHGKRCIVLDMSSVELNDVSAFYYMSYRCPLAGWAHNTNQVAGPLSNLLSGAVFNLQDEYPVSHQFEDLSRMILGYEKPLLTSVDPPANEKEIMEVALQAYTCLLGGLHHNYHNCFSGNDGTWSK